MILSGLISIKGSSTLNLAKPAKKKLYLLVDQDSNYYGASATENPTEQFKRVKSSNTYRGF